MQRWVDSFGKSLRPHTKSHKCSKLAQLQLQYGAIGLCVTKLSEAHALLVTANLSCEILVTSPVVSPVKFPMLLECLSHIVSTPTSHPAPPRPPSLILVVDSPHNAVALDAQIAAWKLQSSLPPSFLLPVLVDLDGGQQRTGVALPSAPSLAALLLSACPNLRLRGLQCYLGHLQHVPSLADRALASSAALSAAAALLPALALPAPLLTGCGTGTHQTDVLVAGVTELQAGSYALMDEEYAQIEWREGRFLGDAEPRAAGYRPPMTLLASVVSNAHLPAHATVDAGLKSLYRDGGRPRVLAPTVPGARLRYEWFGDEHGKIVVEAEGEGEGEGGEGEGEEGGKGMSAECLQMVKEKLALGAVVELMVSHCDPTVNLFDEFVVVDESDHVCDRWKIDLRGLST